MDMSHGGLLLLYFLSLYVLVVVFVLLGGHK